jgi:hypothetical protein
MIFDLDLRRSAIINGISKPDAFFVDSMSSKLGASTKVKWYSQDTSMFFAGFSTLNDGAVQIIDTNTFQVRE